MSRLTMARLDTPAGAVVAVSTDAGLCALEFADHADRLDLTLRRRFGIAGPLPEEACPAAGRLGAYFAGDLEALAGIAVDAGGTPFQRLCWDRLRSIPPGEAWTYSALAERIGRPTAVRAAAHANAINPVCIVVPCHRVVGTDGTLRGYGGGLERKRWLLRHEGVAGW